MSDSKLQIRARVRMLLRRVSDLKLPDPDIDTVIDQVLRGKVQDLSLNGRDQATVVEEVTLTETGALMEFIVDVSVDEFEAEKLEYVAASDPRNQFVGQVVVVPLSAWNSHAAAGSLVASFYGGDKVRMNLSVEDACSVCWQLTYREPLLAIVQSGSKPPIPTGHLEMIDYEVAIKCMPLVEDDTAEWKEWKAETLPVYEGVLKADLARWQNYLDSSVEPQIQPIVRSDRHRSARPIRPLPYVPAS